MMSKTLKLAQILAKQDIDYYSRSKPATIWRDLSKSVKEVYRAKATDVLKYWDEG